MNTFRKILLATSFAAGAVFSAPAVAQTWSWDLVNASQQSLGMNLSVTQTSSMSFTMNFNTYSGGLADNSVSGSWYGADFLNGLQLKAADGVSTLGVTGVSLGTAGWGNTSLNGDRNGFCDNGAPCFYGANSGAGFADIINNTANWSFNVTLAQPTDLTKTGLHLKMDVRDGFPFNEYNKQGKLQGVNLNFGNNTPLSQAMVTPVPEPETYAMMLAGLGVIGAVVRRRRQTQA